MRNPEQLGRREFARLMGASVALAGGACTRQPRETIVPYARSPEETVPGRPLYFASAMALGGYAAGVLVESHEGRPTKVEGNPLHPASLGATDVFAQASVLTLYDPDRARFVTRNGALSRWTVFVAALGEEMAKQRKKGGEGLRVLTPTVTSPTLGQQLESLLDTYPSARWHQYEPVTRDAVREGARLAFGSYINTFYRFDQADVVVALDADFLTQGPGCVRYARDFAGRRGPGAGGMNRLYAVEAVPSLTGAMADHRLRLRPREIAGFARALARRLGVLADGGDPGGEWIESVARDLERHRGRALVVAGESQEPVVHLLAHALNQKLGSVGSAVIQTDPVEALPVNQTESIRELARDLEEGRVDVLAVLGGNPVYDAPADLEFARRLERARFRVHLSLYRDETSELCQWHIPEAHYLESWSDARAFEGTASIIQPLIAPLYDGKSAHEAVAALAGRPDRTGYELLRDYWKGRSYYLSYRAGNRAPSEEDFEALWRRSLHDGVIAGTEADPVSMVVAPNLKRPAGGAAEVDGGGLDLVFRPDPCVWDGRFANNGWLQEAPKPLTKLTWENASTLSPATAREWRVATGDMVALEAAGRRVASPVLVLPGQADGTVGVTLGYGRKQAGSVGTGAGFDAGALRTADALWVEAGVSVRKIGGGHRLATTQEHHRMEGREPARTVLAGAELPGGRETPFSLYPERPAAEHAWGMAIDLSTCTGCNACVVACSAENNIPVVGRDEVLAGREMQWVRVDCYFEGSEVAPEVIHQPVACGQCEHAPCEPVCPVGATVHSAEGLNEMVYNRCVGSRYCANNCPYKVRRFNFYQYADLETPTLKMQRNPDVTVRTRGVIEKCTYCVQRINAARIEARREGRKITDGEVKTACEQACPAQAIVFGDLNDPQSRVARLRSDARGYSLLAELNTRPRTRYLAKVRNPNPELAGGGGIGG